MKEFVNRVIADKIMDAEETAEFVAMVMEDGVIDRPEADAAFEINDGIDVEKSAPEWKDAFVNTVAGHLLADEVVDAEEETWLLEKLGAEIDANERALLDHLKAKGVTFNNPALVALVG